MRKLIFIVGLFSLLIMAPLAFAEASNVILAVSQLCADLTSLLPTVGMLMVVVGAVVYASGQITGAETRARANTWATASLVGAVMAMVISAVTPPVLSAIYSGVNDCQAPAPTATTKVCTGYFGTILYCRMIPISNSCCTYSQTPPSSSSFITMCPPTHSVCGTNMKCCTDSSETTCIASLALSVEPCPP